MPIFNNTCERLQSRVAKSPFSPAWFALLAEFTALSYVGFIILFSLETLLPTFVSARLSLAKYLLVMLILTMLALAFGRILKVHFPVVLTLKHPLSVLGLLWTAAILGLSIMKFPLWSLPILLILFFLAGYYFWQLTQAPEPLSSSSAQKKK